MQICFVGEHAIDTGGPSREFWSLLVKCIDDNLCTGKERNKVFTHDVPALQVHGYVLRMSNFILPCVCREWIIKF